MITYAFQAKNQSFCLDYQRYIKKKFHFVPFCPPSELVGIILQNSMSLSQVLFLFLKRREIFSEKYIFFYKNKLMLNLFEIKTP